MCVESQLVCCVCLFQVHILTYTTDPQSSRNQQRYRAWDQGSPLVSETLVLRVWTVSLFQPKPIRVSAKTGVPLDVLPQRGLTSKQAERMSRINDSDLPRVSTQPRSKQESREERRARKQAVREERKVRRPRRWGHAHAARATPLLVGFWGGPASLVPGSPLTVRSVWTGAEDGEEGQQGGL